MTENWVQRTAAEYAQQFSDLLPQGAVWSLDPTSEEQLVINGIAQVWGNPVESLAALLLQTESDPRITNILLPDWELAWGLPDVCFPDATLTHAQRNTILVQKMTLLGAQSRAFFIAQTASLGYTISIHEHTPYQCGLAKCGETRHLDKGIGYNSTPSVFIGATSAKQYLLTSSSGPGLKYSGNPVGAVNLVFVGGSFVTANAIAAVTKSGGYFVLFRQQASPNYFVWTTDTTGAYVSDSGILTTAQVATNFPGSFTSDLAYQAQLDGSYFWWEVGQEVLRFWWNVEVSALPATGLQGTDIECYLRRWKPAHTAIAFDYGPLVATNFSQAFDSGYIIPLVM